MNLNSRLSRIEAAQAQGNANAIIIAVDEADFRRQFEDLFLSSQPGLLTVVGAIADSGFEETYEMLPHEAKLELLS